MDGMGVGLLWDSGHFGCLKLWKTSLTGITLTCTDSAMFGANDFYQLHVPNTVQYICLKPIVELQSGCK